MYNEHKIIPRGALSWDNSGNNKAFQSGQIAYALNPTSIYSSLITDQEPVPGGRPSSNVRRADLPAASAPPRPTTTACSRSRPIRELAMGLVQHFMKPENYSRFIVEAGGRYLPIYPALLSTRSGRQAGISRPQEAARSARSNYAPGKLTPALSEIVNRSLVVEEVQNMLVKGKDPARAVADAHKTMVEVYKRLGEPT